MQNLNGGRDVICQSSDVLAHRRGTGAFGTHGFRFSVVGAVRARPTRRPGFTAPSSLPVAPPSPLFLPSTCDSPASPPAGGPPIVSTQPATPLLSAFLSRPPSLSSYDQAASSWPALGIGRVSHRSCGYRRRDRLETWASRLARHTTGFRVAPSLTDRAGNLPSR